MTDVARIRTEKPAPHVTRIVLARPEKRNAQDPPLLYALDAAFAAAAADPGTRVVVLAADGPRLLLRPRPVRSVHHALRPYRHPRRRLRRTRRRRAFRVRM